MIEPNTSLLTTFESIIQNKSRENLRIFLKQARLPIVIFAICISISGYFGYLTIQTIIAQDPPVQDIQQPLNTNQHDIKPHTIFVDLSGSVTRPQTYAVAEGTRLFELIEMAGGLNAVADQGYIQRNYNLSVILSDQQKIHIPSVYEVREGYFIERRRLVSLESNLSHTVLDQTGAPDASGISINNASQSELETLPGIGPVTAQRIIAGRPYERLEDLSTRDILKSSLFESLLEFIRL